MSKRTRVSGVEALLDVEATVADNDEEISDDEEEEVTNFIDDDDDDGEEPSLRVYASSTLGTDTRSVGGFDEETTARRFKERSRRETEAERRRLSTELHMWMIRVPENLESLNADRLNERLLEPSRAFSVSSLPSRFYVLAPNAALISRACENLAGLERAPFLSVPYEEHNTVVKLRDEVDSLPRYEVDDWVTLRRGPYKGDLARVRAVSDTSDSLTVAVVPRIGKKDEKQMSRPPPLLFNFEKISELCEGEKIKKLSDTEFRFRRRLFRNGLCELKLPGIHFVKKARPTLCDIVRMISGSLFNLSGVVDSIEDERVLVRDILDSVGTVKFDTLWVPRDEVRRILNLGDHVRMTFVEPPVEGMITMVNDDELSISEVVTRKTVTCRTKWVETYDPDFRMENIQPSSPTKGPPRHHDRYHGLRIYVKQDKYSKGSYGYVLYTHPTKSIAHISRDGVIGSPVFVVDLKNLIAVKSVSCLDGKFPLTETERERYVEKFRALPEPSLPGPSLPGPSGATRSSTPPPESSELPIDGEAAAWVVGELDVTEARDSAADGAITVLPPPSDFSGRGMWLFAPAIQARFPGHKVHFTRLSLPSRPTFLEAGTKDSFDHTRCVVEHNRCRVRVTLQNAALNYRSDYVDVRDLIPKLPKKGYTALVINGNAENVGKIVMVKGFVKDNRSTKSAHLAELSGTHWNVPEPVQNITRIEAVNE
ncbi:hypothetical protein DFH11DRAFT_1729213 [Phellopilus nigrolimitatus]|nr:hypothetical protein DFH11DRAFT_1729213 [Phellopilus nigrolimitatus]